MEEQSAFQVYAKTPQKPARKQRKPKQTAKSESIKKVMELAAGGFNAKQKEKNEKKRDKKRKNSDAINAVDALNGSVVDVPEPKATVSQKKKKKAKNEVAEDFTGTIAELTELLGPQKKTLENGSPSKSQKTSAVPSKKKKNLNTEATSELSTQELPKAKTPKKKKETVTSIADTCLPPADSIEEGLKVLKWIINPINTDQFFEKFWEKAPCLIQRDDSDYFGHLISFKAIDQMLVNNYIEFTKNIDITSYKNGQRETLNPEGRALPPLVWEHYADGCSIRLLNPQTYIPAVYAMNATIQEFFHCMVGANVYLTPPNSQGFAPHYDDIEAFVLQIEGRKRWKLYNPRSKTEVLPRNSSTNFHPDEIGEPILDKVLKPGDVLYFPRGIIHQACTEPGYHSLHITLSVYQKQSYADLFETLYPMIISKAIEKSVQLRRGLPINIWRTMGLVYTDVNSKERTEMLTRLHNLLRISMNELPFDDAVDQLAKKFQHDALPPVIAPSERSLTVFGARNHLNGEGEVVTNSEICLETTVRLLRANILRLVQEEGSIRVYFYVDNSREYHEYEPNFLEIESQDAICVEMLIKCYPEYIMVKELPSEEDERKVSVVHSLWERGLLMLEKPLPE